MLAENQGKFDSSQLVKICNGVLYGNNFQAVGLSTDSRNIQAKQLFVALRGENFDGGKFLDQVAEKNAAAAIVHEFKNIDIPQIVVSDTLKALQDIAKYHRSQYQDIFLTAITGSNGKTTTKEILKTIFSSIAPTLATVGNLNNDIGVPQTLLSLNAEHKFAVIEMGASHLDDISRLMSIVNPNCALITNIANAHLQGFGDLDGVALAKSAIYRESQGIIVLNNDLDYATKWSNEFSNRQIISFALQNKADLSAKNISADGKQFSICFDGKTAEVSWNLVGVHNVKNALAAVACALAQGIDIFKSADAINNLSLEIFS